MKITAEDIFRSLEKLGVRRGFPFRSEPLPQRSEGERLVARAQAMGRENRSWSVDIFPKQARFLEQFEPEMTDFVPCDSLSEGYASPYNRLDQRQLLYYFAWRAAFRRGEKAKCDNGYAMLFLHETLAGFGATQSQRMALWTRLLLEQPDLNSHTRSYLIEFIIDQYAISDDPVPFWDRMAQCGAVPADFGPFYAYDRRLPPGTLAYALTHGNYDPRTGKFIKEEDMPRLEAAFDAACQAMFDLLESRNIKGEILMWGRAHKDPGWRPFYLPYVTYKPPKIQRKGDAVISATEKYTFKRGELSRYRSNPWNSHQTVWLGYLLKRCEARMRIHDKYRYRLNPKPVTLRKDLFQHGLRYKQFTELLDSGEFDRVVDAAIDRALAPRPQKREVRLDFSRLEDIRRDADIVRRELTVEEDQLYEPSAVQTNAGPGAQKNTAAKKTGEKSPETAVPEVARTETPSPDPKNRPQTGQKPEPKGQDTPMGRLVASLTDLQRQGLCRLLQGESARSAAGEQMAEVFWEEINERSLDNLGDTVYNAEEAAIYEDYEQELRDCLGL